MILQDVDEAAAFTDAAGIATTYTYDAAGRRASATDTAGRTTSYAYGPSGLLDTVTLPDGQHVDYAYDAAGRRTGVDYSDATPDVSFTYDDAGRATAMTDGTGTTAYSYDALGRPLEVDGPDATVGYAWDAVGQLTALTYPTGEVVEHAFVYGVGGTPLAQVGLVGGAVDYLHTDLIGSVVATTGSTAQVTSEADYDVYGLAVAVAGQVRSGEVTRFGYAGEYADPTGYVYLRARYYDPATAQFLTRDPLVGVTGNPYGYTDGNPLQHVDPLGLDWWNPTTWSADTLDNIALGASTVGVVLAATGVGAPVAAALAVVGTAAPAGATYRRLEEGDAVGAGLSVLGVIPGVGSVAARASSGIARFVARTTGSLTRASVACRK